MAFISGEIYDEVTKCTPYAKQALATWICKNAGINEIATLYGLTNSNIAYYKNQLYRNTSFITSKKQAESRSSFEAIFSASFRILLAIIILFFI